MRYYDENTENLGNMVGTMKYVGAFTCTHAPPRGLGGGLLSPGTAMGKCL
jgi:hypothetical protein